MNGITISKILSDEHKNILIAIENLKSICNAFKNNKDVDREFLKQIIEFIKNYADRFHHSKEEDILFNELLKKEVKGKMHCNPVEQMLYEHNLGRKFVKEMEKGLNENNKEKIIENAENYSDLLTEHIFKEDNILYPIAEEVLNKDIKKKIINKFIEIAEKNKSKKNKYLLFIKKTRYPLKSMGLYCLCF